MTATVWQPGSSSIVANAENGSLIQPFTATSGQTVFTLTLFNYAIGTGSIRVYRNGVKLQQSEVSETDSSHFTLVGVVLAAGEIIECSAVLGSQDAVTAAALSAAASAAAAAASAASIDVSNLLSKAANLSDVANIATARANLGAAPSATPTFTGVATVEKIRLGASATLANNFIFAVPTVPDGTLSITRESGTVVATIDAAGKVAFPGNAQTWQNVTASRVVGTSYPNNTGQPITVYCNGTSGTANSAVLITVVQGAVTTEIRGNTQAGTGIRMSGYAQVPAGATYTVTNSSGGGLTVIDWEELR